MKVTIDIDDTEWWAIAKRADDEGVKVPHLVRDAIRSLTAPISVNGTHPIAEPGARVEVAEYHRIGYSVPEIMTRTGHSRARIIATLDDLGLWEGSRALPRPRSAPYRRFTRQEDAEIRRLAEAGAEFGEIATLLHAKPDTIRKKLAHWGLNPKENTP